MAEEVWPVDQLTKDAWRSTFAFMALMVAFGVGVVLLLAVFGGA